MAIGITVQFTIQEGSNDAFEYADHCGIAICTDSSPCISPKLHEQARASGAQQWTSAQCGPSWLGNMEKRSNCRGSES